MRKTLLALALVLVFSTLAFAVHIDPALTDAMKSAKGLVPVIVQMNPGAKHVDVTQLGGKLGYTYTIINGFSAELPVAAINALAKNPNVYSISADKTMYMCMNVAAPTVNCDDLWAQGYDGDGVGIAVVDTGIYPHADFGTRIVGFKDFINSRTTAYDDQGHGTHVAGIAAGAGTTYKGAAPHAKLIGVKVLNSSGSGSTSVIISGLNWILSNKATYGIKVVVMPIGGPVSQSSTTDPTCSAVRSLVNGGLVVVTTAGGSGPSASTIGCPGNEPLSVTAGASDDKGTLATGDDTIASFSSRGPTSIDGWTKPDLLAPGVNITSCSNTGGYVTMSGTSMSTALIGGICAQVLEAWPTWTPAQVKSNLTGSCRSLGLPANSQGAGIVDAYYSVH